MATLREKIEKGLLKRDVVENVLKQYKSKLDHHKSQYENLTGFERDTYVSRNGIMEINYQIDLGEKILNLMQEMGI